MDLKATFLQIIQMILPIYGAQSIFFLQIIPVLSSG